MNNKTTLLNGLLLLNCKLVKKTGSVRTEMDWTQVSLGRKDQILRSSQYSTARRV
jgi:hypothetical protein